jgi:DNA-binding protein H-NS
MDVDALTELRAQVEDALSGHRIRLEKQLRELGRTLSLGRGHSLKGKKVAPKYRGPGGETWAGRGATPRWLVAAMRGGKKREDFLIDKSAATGRKKRKAKR